ncbi:MAG: endonuclease MutS2 [Epsilonproteobacteria bacterium]|nr:endonuclease MutS2 [Campylobacterota bacterium]
MQNIINKLDLEDYINSLKGYFAREKSIILQGDINIHYKLIDEIGLYNFNSPKKTSDVTNQINHLKKQGTLKLYEIYEFIKIVEYFKYIKRFSLENRLKEWIDKIIIPKQIDDLAFKFDEDGNLKIGQNEDFDRINENIYRNKIQIKEALQRAMSNQKLQPYLVDHQVHLVHGQQAIMVRGGFNHILKAKVIDRSGSGFFYVVPESVKELRDKQEELLELKEEILLKLCREFSNTLNVNILFLSFLDKEFDRFDHYLARVLFAKIGDKNFILPSQNRKIQKLIEFTHPALKNGKSVTIDFSKSVIMITGVNAGGKTMLLKSILSAVFLSKYLIPYNAHKSTKVGHYKDILAILDDPQSVKNDISTFAGRMVEFSHLFQKENAIVGVDEIELGTDSDEAASLFKVIIEKLMKKDMKIIITTHHKRLASLLASYDEVELIAALYDEVNRRPTYDFLNGTIGMSYAFETALRYGIPNDIVNQAKEVYGDDKDKLSSLIAKSSSLELEYKRKIKELDEKIENNERLKRNLNEQKESLDNLILEEKSKLHKEYKDVKEEAKQAIKAKMYQESHKHLNVAHQKVAKIEIQKVEEKKEFKVNDRVKYNNTKGIVLSIKGNKAYIETDEGIKLQVPMDSLKPSGNPIKVKQKIKVDIEKPKTGDIKIDLHGQRADEAIENLDRFISDCLINGFQEVLVYHGIGTGKLSYAVKKFLDAHPRVSSYSDAMPNQGGFGAKVVKL